MGTIILASASPRRKKLLEQIGLTFKVVKSNIKEALDVHIEPHTLAEKLSLQKAKDVAKKEKESLIIAADTLIVFEDEILGKPKNAIDARKILKMLSGNIHIVITGFTILDSSTGILITKSVETKVFMKEMTDEEIHRYIATGEPLDKAGAYGIQGKGAIFVEKIEGDYSNVVGLPLFELTKELKKFNV
ncbi:septum formation protein Maf [Candidatus Roizmanbacteria bacterium RIFCSPHIGHO2_02_FULL_40_9]|uniref:dTTP/UTP pyrophosphatase n=1 Tax=Candidatus Roizmanbacteria bacterium RIFCSPHIGHO2_02_FULL_40_9 TaxID=1802042 RepID=A0A1F7HDW6_9BACT|nr:MAG: septum formation protein Maf [Candidatus Roizmanbacteria bacterium RIFCSPHIGHO2_02_FULL_40_9]